MLTAERADNRWELYKVLGEPQRLRLLALADAEELAIGELAELLDDSQPNVSRHLAPLRRLGLLDERKQGTRVFVRLSRDASSDPVVADALRAGRELCASDDVFERIARVVGRRDAPAREFFARASDGSTDQATFPQELPAYLAALAPLVSPRGLAIDVGTGHGPLLDVLAPVFERVIAVDREPEQLKRAAERAAQRGYANVQLVEADLDDREAMARVRSLGPADVVFASRVLHHAPRPLDALTRLADLLRPSGTLIILDYCAHEDEAMREGQADLWLGFTERELLDMAREARLAEPRVARIPESFCGSGPDCRLGWQVLSARRDGAATATPLRG